MTQSDESDGALLDAALAFYAGAVLFVGVVDVRAGAPRSEWLWELTAGAAIAVVAIESVLRRQLRGVDLVAAYGQLLSAFVGAVAFGVATLVGLWGLYSGHRLLHAGSLVLVGLLGIHSATAPVYVRWTG